MAENARKHANGAAHDYGRADVNWRPLMGPIAQRLADLGLIGTVNRRLSKKTQLRFNGQGSLSIDLTKGTWFDHEQKCGGGVLDLVMYGIGGTTSEALKWLEDNQFLPPKPKSKDKKVRAARGASRIVATYDYRDALGVLVFQVVRREPKDFRQRRPKPDGGWIWDIKGTQPVPYRLQPLTEAIAAEQTVFILEGEKNCEDAAEALGIVATTNAGGAGNWRPALNDRFRGADVVLIPDNDEVGREHMREVTTQLRGIPSKLRILDLAACWPECPHKGDITNWIDAGGAAAEFWQLVEQHAAAPVHVIENTAENAAQRICDSLPGVRRKAGNLPQISTEAENHLVAAGVDFYQRGGVLVRPVTCSVSASNDRQTNAVRLMDVSAIYMRDMLGRHMRFQQYRKREKDYVDADAPADVAETIIARAGDWKFPSIQGVLTTQTQRPDGTILGNAGYDRKTQLLLVGPPDLPPIPETPSRDDAVGALKTLLALFAEFPFVDEASRSVALSAALTAVARAAFSVPPMHGASSPTPGTGKSTLWDVVSAIATGQPCHVIAAGGDETETEKRLAACVLAGYPLFSIDNVNGELGGDFLCQLTERPLLSPRVLGKSEQPLLPNRGTVLATGNNMRLRGDMVRRGLIARLDARTEQPELRRFTGNPVETVLGNRGLYVAAALTITRSYVVAGRPDRAPPFGSYGAWSDTVRSPLIWLGCADPVDTVRVARSEDPELQALSAVLNAWTEAVGAGPRNARTAAQILLAANDGPALREAIDLTGANARKSPSRALGNWLAGVRGRIVEGRSFARLSDSRAHGAEWFVEDAT
jgi:putative DNA primase/helicase